MKQLFVCALCIGFVLLVSCKQKANPASDYEYIEGVQVTRGNNYIQFFFQQNVNKVEMIYPVEYYKTEITNYESVYYGFTEYPLEITDLMNISSIIKLDDFIPHFLTFLVSWFNPKGYVYYVYVFDDEQKLIEHYSCGQFNIFENHRILMEKLPGEKLQYGDVSTGDFNNDGITEVLLYSWYKNIGDVFCVYGFNIEENKLEELCLVPVCINYVNPFPSVEYIENGFKILEVLEEESLELSWNNYIWQNDIREYIKQ
jgi:hypothetical protein